MLASLMVNFLLRKIFLGNLTGVISLVEIDVIFKVKSISANEIVSFRFPREIFLKRKSALHRISINQMKFTIKGTLMQI